MAAFREDDVVLVDGYLTDDDGGPLVAEHAYGTIVRVPLGQPSPVAGTVIAIDEKGALVETTGCLPVGDGATGVSGPPVATVATSKPRTMYGIAEVQSDGLMPWDNLIITDLHGAPVERVKVHSLDFTPPHRRPTSVPDVETLARALFDTDPDVLAFVRERADAVCTTSRETTSTLRYKGRPLRTESIKIDASRYGKAIQRALDVAWRRDENGWASRWRKRAAEALEKLGGAR